MGYSYNITMATAVKTRKELSKAYIELNYCDQHQDCHSLGPVLHEHLYTFFYCAAGCTHVIHEDDLLSLNFT